jgi:hypothetical protein
MRHAEKRKPMAASGDAGARGHGVAWRGVHIKCGPGRPAVPLADQPASQLRLPYPRWPCQAGASPHRLGRDLSPATVAVAWQEPPVPVSQVYVFFR